MIEEYYWESQLFVQIFWIFVFQSKRKKGKKKRKEKRRPEVDMEAWGSTLHCIVSLSDTHP